MTLKLMSTFLLADAAAPEVMIRTGSLWHSIVAVVCFSVIGLIILAGAIALMSKLMPLPFWKEIEEDQNVALGIMVGSIIIGVSIIIAASIHG